MEKKALEEQGLNSDNTVFPSFLDSTPSFLNFCQLPEVLPAPKKVTELENTKPRNEKNQNPLKKENEPSLTMSFLDDNQDFLVQLTKSTHATVNEPQKEKHIKFHPTRGPRSESGILKVKPETVNHIKTGNKPEDSDYTRTPVVKHSSSPTQLAVPARTTIPKTLIVVVYCVLDTNVYIHNLANVKQIINDSSIRLVVPLVVTRELDGLKKHHLHAVNAQHANQLLLNYKNKIIGQLPHETVSQEPPTTNDESIIHCASYFQKKVCDNTVLVSNDKNLQVHAIYHFGLSSMPIKQFISENVKKQKYEMGALH
jgi:rRNA-processing protein FCF1